MTEALKQGYIRQSTSPAASSAFFVAQKPFIAEVVGSTKGVGALTTAGESSPSPSMCILFQESHPSSARLSQNYDISNKELLAIKLALEKW